MDNFSFSSDDVDENAVEELLAQFLDEEVLKITTLGASSECGLDPELEARYEKLKRAWASNPRPRKEGTKHDHRCSNAEDAEKLTPQKGNKSFSDSNSSSSTAQGDSSLSPSERRRLDDSHSCSSRTLMASPSPAPARRSCSPPQPRSCFCGASPKKLLRSLSSKKSHKKTLRSDGGSDSSRFSGHKSGSKLRGVKDGEIVSAKVGEREGNFRGDLDSLSDDELLTDLNTFSLKSQEKQLKKARREENKVSRDAEKLVEWVKQASARLEVSISDDDMSLSEEELK